MEMIGPLLIGIAIGVIIGGCIVLSLHDGIDDAIKRTRCRSKRPLDSKSAEIKLPENASYDDMTKVYNQWIYNIVMDVTSKHDEENLIEHLHKHVNELATEGASETWIASMVSLVEITRQAYHMSIPTTNTLVNRLYSHWVDCPDKNTPPPFIYATLHPTTMKIVETDVRRSVWDS